MKIFPQTRQGCGCLVGAASLASMTFVSMLLAVWASPGSFDAIVSFPSVLVLMGVCGALLGVVGTLHESAKRAALAGALMMSLPFVVLLALSLAGAHKLNPARMGALAVSAGVLGALTSSLARRVSLDMDPSRDKLPRLQFSVISVLLAGLFIGALFGFVRTLFWNR